MTVSPSTAPAEPMPEDGWWKEAVFYQVYPRSFADSDGDGVGDLPGLVRALDHLQWLGVDGIWLSPIYPSPMHDFGYDVLDHCAVDPVFGTLADVDRLVAEAHRRGIRVLLDWVPNHTSSSHPWFLESRSSRESRLRDWYIWRDGRDDAPPNNWRAAFGGPAWTWDEATRQWYLHLFLPEQPDLNWSNPAVREAMTGTLRFWLDRGVDGFRIDVVHCIGKDPLLPDQPPDLAEVDRVRVHDHPGTHELIREIRAVVDEYEHKVIVGEVSLRDTIRIAAYYGRGDELHLAFNFLSLDAGWRASDWVALVSAVGRGLGESAWPTWALSNHDVSRHRTRFGGGEQRARAAAVLLLSLRGTPFVYAGEELGLEDATVLDEQRLDPGGRDGCRAPLPWRRAYPHGWPGGAWLPFANGAGERSVEAQRDDESSILTLYRRLLRLRRGSAALRRGSLELVDAPAEVLAFERVAGDETKAVAVNFGDRRAPVGYDGWVVEASSAPGAARLFDGTLPPETAVVLARRAERPRRSQPGEARTAPA